MKKYPFKFLDAYSKEDTGIFFGRDEEINTLYEMVFQSSILLVYGASGTGKTSLIQCGLASKFPSHDWLALTVRRGNNINANFEKALADAGGTFVAEQDNMDWLAEVMEEKEVISTPPLLTPLAQAFKAIYLNSFKPIYLIFDQFEELFILGSKEEEQQFITIVQEILQIEQPVKMIFSIREEYLGYLYDFEKAVPQLLRKKLRVEPMNLNKVLQVIEGATSYKNSNVRLKTDEANLIAESIFEKIKDKEKSLTIQLPYLQVFLDKFYLKITGDETRQREAVFTAEALSTIGDIGDILQNFLEEQVAGISKKLSQGDTIILPATIWNILSPFATLEGTKEPIRKKGLYERLPDINAILIDAVVEAFINGRILRYTEDVDLYELAHDSLAQRIAEKRSDEEIALLEIKRLVKAHTSLKANARELFSEKQLNFIEPFLGKLQLTAEEMALIDESRETVAGYKEKEKQQLEKEKRDLLERQRLLEKNQNSQKRFIWVISSALAVMMIIAIWAIGKKRQADNAENKAGIALAEANNAKTAAIKAQDSTRLALERANTAKIIAVKARDSTKIALANANESEKIANTQKEKAEQAKKNAINAEDSTQTALVHAKKLINAFYFYHGNLALAQGSNKAYGFIDKNGDAAINYLYKNVEQFDYSGFAKVKKVVGGRTKKTVDYLIDTAGLEYTVAYNLEDLNERVVALDLRNQYLGKFPAEIFKYPQLQIILFGHNYIKELPAEIGQLKNLKNLDLSGNGLHNLPPEIEHLTNLQNLDLHNNSLEFEHTKIGRLKNLKILDVSDNLLQSLPPEIKQLTKLQDLILTDNNLQSLPPEIGQLANLQNLDLHHNSLEHLPAEIGQLHKLKTLNLGKNELQSLSPQIKELKNLNTLDVSENGLQSLPAEIGQLMNLQNLNLNHNKLERLPIDIGRLKTLQSLDLSSNLLKSWPTQTAGLKNLETLDVSGNGLQSLLPEVGQLTNLQNLNLKYNGLDRLPAEIGRLKKMQNLDLSSNGLQSLPAEIGQLTNLQNLNLEYNKLAHLPIEFARLKRLQNLNFRHNLMKSWPTQIEKLKNLETLDISNNGLQNLPAGIGQVKKLRQLFIADNHLNNIPPEVGQLKNLKMLFLLGNVISEPALKKIKELLPQCQITSD